MGDAGDKCALRLAATARKWLEDVRVDREGRVHPAVASGGQALTWLATAGARVSLAEPGRVVCSLRVGAPLTDAEGRWHAGAIAVAADNVCAAAVFTALGADVLTVQYSLSYFSPAHLDVRAMRGGGDGGASGGPEGGAGGRDGGGAEERVRRAGGDLQAVDGTSLDNKGQHKHEQQALKKCRTSLANTHNGCCTPPAGAARQHHWLLVERE
eukprot:XP_008664230.1 uncharacterized protein LOC103642829 isoform X1 [Zea mays]